MKRTTALILTLILALPNLPVSEPFYIFVGGILGIVLRRTD